MELFYEKDDFISKEVCERVIKKFEQDERKIPGRTAGDSKNHKKTTDLPIQYLPEWFYETSIMNTKINLLIRDYIEHLAANVYNHLDDAYVVVATLAEMIHPYGVSWFQIQRYNEGEFYRWHCDASPPASFRVFTFIIYLNTLDEECGGATEFTCGKKIQPKAGKLLFFPAAWPFIHRAGVVKSGTKYIITGFIYTDMDPAPDWNRLVTLKAKNRLGY